MGIDEIEGLQVKGPKYSRDWTIPKKVSRCLGFCAAMDAMSGDVNLRAPLIFVPVTDGVVKKAKNKIGADR